MSPFDVVLALLLVGLACRVLATRDLFEGIVLFIAFGLLMALAWVRLQAPDVALAEAAIGAGLTGALLLDALRGMRASDRQLPVAELYSLRSLALLIPMSALVLFLVGAVVRSPSANEEASPPEARVAGALVRERLEESGVSQPVTAVLLNFRGYDTLLEVGVLLLALMGVLALASVGRQEANEARYTAGTSSESLDLPSRDPVLGALARLLVPVMLLAGGYLLWTGTRAPGGAFQAGAVLAAAGVLLRLGGLGIPVRLDQGWFRALAVCGFVLFLLVAFGAIVSGGAMLEYRGKEAARWIVLIEGFLTVTTAVVLAGLFVAAARVRRAGRFETDPRRSVGRQEQE